MIVGSLTDWLEGMLARRGDTVVGGDLVQCAQALLDESGEMRALLLAQELLAHYRDAGAAERELPQLRHFQTLSPVPGLVHWLRGERSALARRWLQRLDSGGELPGEANERAALVAHYLLKAKRGDGCPSDPVARFHLANGARLERVIADANPRAAASSPGVMVSYAYLSEQLEANHNAYHSAGKVTASGAVKSLVRKIGTALIDG